MIFGFKQLLEKMAMNCDTYLCTQSLIWLIRFRNSTFFNFSDISKHFPLIVRFLMHVRFQLHFWSLESGSLFSFSLFFLIFECILKTKLSYILYLIQYSTQYKLWNVVGLSHEISRFVRTETVNFKGFSSIVNCRIMTSGDPLHFPFISYSKHYPWISAVICVGCSNFLQKLHIKPQSFQKK